MTSLTFVTCLYDLVKRGSTRHRTIDELLSHANFVLGLDYELVIFTEPEWADEVTRRRGTRPTRVITTPYEVLIGGDRVTASLRGQLQGNASKTKVTSSYVQLMWAKYTMLEKALRSTKTSHIGWIDLGIEHIAKRPPENVNIFADLPVRMHVHALRCFTKQEVDHPDYWKNVHGHLAGGLVVGPCEAMRRLIHDFGGAIDRAIAMGLAPLDEGLLSYVVAQRPNDFVFSYGDYADILQNYDVPRGGEAHCQWIREDARSRGLRDAMEDTSRFMFDPARWSARVTGFPAVILKYPAEGSPNIVPGRYERDLIDWAQQLSPRHKQFVDCGAHMGSWALVMAKHFREVHAFEPQRLIFQQLCGNIALNGIENVYTYNMGLDERPGQLTIRQRGADYGGTTARSDLAPLFVEHKGQVAETIPVVQLDDFAHRFTDVGLIKIDVEGLEQRVLKGALQVLRNNNLPPMLIECWAFDWYAREKEALLQFLNEIGYRAVPIMGYGDMILAERKP